MSWRKLTHIFPADYRGSIGVGAKRSANSARYFMDTKTQSAATKSGAANELCAIVM